MLNKYDFDVRLTAIGVDFFQVLAVFGNAKVQWPQQIKDLFRLLSAFNLNIEIVAPECLMPDVTFKQKFGFVLALPFVVVAAFAVVTALRLAWARWALRQTRWKSQLRRAAPSIAIVLILLFLFYLYVTKTVLSVWECLPTDPDDGKLYLQVAFEECGRPGGVQEALSGWAAMGAVVVVAGYPLTVLAVLLLNREAVMEDQLLRALGVAPPRDSTLALLRASLGRTYYQFKPDFAPFWLLAILLRKFAIAFSALMFARNSAFQLSMCLLILFIAFTAQARYRPYMPSSEYEAVLAAAAGAADTSPLYNRLKARVAGVEASTRKRTHRNAMDGGGVARRVTRRMFDWALNYNSIEAVLLFDAALVSLLGVLYDAVRPTDVYYASSRTGITAFLMVLIVAGGVYFAAVFAADITGQYNDRRAAAATAARAKSKGNFELTPRTNRRSTGFDAFRHDRPSATVTQTATNPMFLKEDGKADVQSALASTIADTLEPPSAALWNVVRDNYTALAAQVAALTEQLNTERAAGARLREAMADSDLRLPLGSDDSPSRGGGGGGGGGGGVEAMLSSRRLIKPAGSSRRVFNPTRMDGSPADLAASVPRRDAEADAAELAGALSRLRADEPPPSMPSPSRTRTTFATSGFDGAAVMTSRRALVAARRAGATATSTGADAAASSPRV